MVHVPVVLVAEVDAEVGVDGAHHVHQPARHEPDLAAPLQSIQLFDDSVTHFCIAFENIAIMRQVPLERVINIAVNGPFLVEVANQEHPFMAMLTSRTCLI